MLNLKIQNPILLKLYGKYKLYSVVGELMLLVGLSGYYWREDLFGTFIRPHSISLANMLLQRAGNIGEHDISWAMIFLFTAYCRLKLSSKQINIIATALLGLFFIGLDEETWNLVYYINVGILRQDIASSIFINPPPVDATVGWVGIQNLLFTKPALFMITAIALIVPMACKIWRYFDTKRLFIATGIFFSYFIIWTAIGFPTTVSFFGETIWYHNLFVNGLECLHWTIGSISLMWAFKGEIPISFNYYKLKVYEWWYQDEKR